MSKFDVVYQKQCKLMKGGNFCFPQNLHNNVKPCLFNPTSPNNKRKTDKSISWQSKLTSVDDLFISNLAFITENSRDVMLSEWFPAGCECLPAKTSAVANMKKILSVVKFSIESSKTCKNKSTKDVCSESSGDKNLLFVFPASLIELVRRPCKI